MNNKYLLLLTFFVIGSLHAMSRHPDQTKHYREQAEKGDVEAAYQFGMCLVNGKGVEHDFKEAAGWLLLASSQGHAEAPHLLAAAYACGRGVTQDFVRAAYWAQIGIDRGSSSAGALLEDLIDQNPFLREVLQKQRFKCPCFKYPCSIL